MILGFLPLGVNVLLAPVYTVYLSPADFGIIGLAQIFGAVVSILIGGGIPQAYARYYFDYRHSSEEKQRLLSTAIFTILILGISLFPLFWIGAEYVLKWILSSDEFLFSNYGYIVFFTALATLLHTILVTFYRNEERVRSYSIWSLGFFLLSVVGILIGVVYYEAGAMGSILGRALTTSGVAILLVILVGFTGRLTISKEMLKGMFAFGFALIPYALILMVFNSLDRILVERFFGIDMLGYYNLAWLLASSTSVFLYALYNAISPVVFKHLTDKELTGEKITIIKRALETMCLAVVLFIGLAFLAIPLFVEYLIDVQFQVILPYLGVLFLLYVLQVYYVIYTIPFYHTKKTRPLAFIVGFSVVVGGLAFYFGIQFFGFLGAFMGVGAMRAIQFLTTLLYLRGVDKNDRIYLKLNRMHLFTFLVFSISALLFAGSHFLGWDITAIYYVAGLLVMIISMAFYAKYLRELRKIVGI